MSVAKSILDIVIRFAKEGDADKDTVRALVNIKSSVTQATVVMAALAGVGYTLNQVYKQTVGVFEEYALQVSDLSRLTGASMEETSRIIQLADDMRISYEDLTKALWFASKNGVEVNIESLARLADQYNGFNSATERAAFLAKVFGRNGAEMGKLLSAGGEGVQQLAAAISNSLILTEEAEKKAREYQIAVDGLADAWMGVRTQIGEALTPFATDFLNDINDLTRAMELARDAGASWGEMSQAMRQVFIDQAAGEREVTTALKMHSKALAEDTAALEQAAAPLLAYKNAMSDLSTLISGDLGKAEDDHLQRIQELNLELEKVKPQEKGGIQEQIDAETAAYERQTNAILYNIQSQIIMRNTNVSDPEKLVALTQLADSYGLIDAKTRSAVDATNALVSSWMAGALTTDELVTRLGNVATLTASAAEGASSAALSTESLHGVQKEVGLAAEGAVTPLGHMETAMSGVRQEAQEAAGEIASVKKQAEALNGMVAVVTIIIETIGEMPSMGKPFGGKGGTGAGATGFGGTLGKTHAAGGQWMPGDWALVGDMPGGGIGPFTEVIDPWGYIHNARETRMLASLGLLNNATSLYETEGTGAFGGSRLPNRRGNLTEVVQRVRAESGGRILREGEGTASLSAIVAPMQESTAAAGDAARSAAMASDRQAEQSVRQTDAIRSGNEDLLEELQTLRRELPQAMQDAVKLVV